MARIRSFAFTEGTVASASPSADMPEHVSGDVLLVFVNCDLTSVNAAGAGWTSLDNNLGAGHGWRIEYRVATGSTHTYSTTLAASDTFTITVVAIKGAHGTPIDVNAARKTDDATVPFAGIGATTNFNNSLVFQFLSTDGGLGPTCEPPWTNLVTGDAGANSGGVAYMVKKTAGSIPAPDWRGTVNDNTNAAIVAIRDSGSLDFLPGYIQQDTTPGTLLEHGYWIISGGANSWGNSYPTALSLGTIGSKTTVFDAAALQTDQGLNPYWAVVNCTPTSSTNGANVGGPQLNFNAAKDLTGGILLFNFFFTTSRDYVDISTPTDSGQAGLLLVSRDATAYKAWSVAAKNTKSTKPDGYNVCAVQIDQSTNTKFASSGTHVDTAVDGILTLAQGRYGAVAFRWNNLCIANAFALAGGTSSDPLNFEDMDQVLNNSLGNQRIMIREGSAATFVAPVTIGGTDPVHVKVNLRTLQFRTQSDGLNYLDWHVDDNKAGFEFDGQASDTIHYTNCVFVSGSPTYWRFNSGHSASASIDFSGSVVINQTVTLRATSDLDAVTFIDCPTFTSNGAALTNCTFSNTKVSCASPAEAAEIASSSFEFVGTGHAIEVGGTAADFTLSGCTFDGYSGTGVDAAIYVNIATGTVNISITNGGDTPSIRTAGATVNVINARLVRVTAKDADTAAVIEGARVLLYATTGASVTITRSGSTATVSHTAHGYANGQKVVILGANEGEYNGIKTISNVSANAYDYTVSGTPATPATGTINSHRGILDGDTNGFGFVEDASFPYTTDLAVTGRVRKGTAATFYKNALVSGTITSAAGFETTAFMVKDT
jgi:hypothetical protein